MPPQSSLHASVLPALPGHALCTERTELYVDPHVSAESTPSQVAVYEYQTSAAVPAFPQAASPSLLAQAVEPVKVPLPMAVALPHPSFAGGG